MPPVIRTVAICYFSGTGNTEYVVELARDALVLAGVEVDLFRIEDLHREAAEDLSAASYDMLGIAHPVLGFGCPALVRSFVRSLPRANGTPAFILKTAGDYHSVNNSSSHAIKAILSSAGYDPFYEEIVVMPSNWFVAYDDRLNRQLVEVAPERVDAAIRRILAGERRALSNRWSARIILKAIGHLEDRHGAARFGRSLQASAACTRCGRCERECPSGNIRVGPHGVAFGAACLWCMRCIYNCPERAIDSKYMNAVILTGGYSLARIRGFRFEPIDFSAPGLPFWHRYFRRYFSD